MKDVTEKQIRYIPQESHKNFNFVKAFVVYSDLLKTQFEISYKIIKLKAITAIISYLHGY